MKTLSPKMYLKMIQRFKDELKHDQVIQEMCDKYDFDVEDIDLVPIKFGDIDVSARTDKGVITLNWKLLEQNDESNDIKSYICHELNHYLAQSKAPTKSADDGDYLMNPDEQNAFQYQVKYIDHHHGEDEAEEYVEQVLDHHEVEDTKERQKKEDILMKLVE
jgi:hypothetical protein